MTTTTTPLPLPPASPGRRVASWLHRRPAARVGLLLSGPLGWLGVLYLGSLVVLFVNAFFTTDPFTGRVVYDVTLDNFTELLESPYPTITLRTLLMAGFVTASCAVLAYPIAYYMARVASPRVRSLLVVAVLVPLWASYLVKVYAWRLVLAEDGILNWALTPLGLAGPGFGDVAVWLVFTYLWLPYMILPVYAGMERIPGSLLEASSDLGGRSWTTFRRVILPLTVPALVAGSIFTFSLTLGDYIAPAFVSTTIFIGNAIQAQVGPGGNLPFAAAYALVPLLIMLVYLVLARRTGAFEAL